MNGKLRFHDSKATRVADNTRELKAVPGWTAVDLRSLLPRSVHQVLAKTLAAPKLAVILDTARALPADALLLIRALHDSHDAVRWDDGTESVLPANRILYVIASGARELEEVPRELWGIGCMIFIRAPASALQPPPSSSLRPGDTATAGQHAKGDLSSSHSR